MDEKDRLFAGFARVAINPGPGTGLEGYYIERRCEGVLDDIEVNAAAFGSGPTSAVLLAADLCLIKQRYCDVLRKEVASAAGLPFGSVIISCTHTHTSPIVSTDPSQSEETRAYFPLLRDRLVQAAKEALSSMLPVSSAGYRTGSVPGISHCRRIRMRDGSILTNPGTGNPDAVCEVTKPDSRVGVLRLDREGGDTLIFAGYGNHPDSIGGCKVSADYPGFFRRTFERAVPGTKCVYINGAEGDINFIDVWAKGGDLNDTFRDFDDVFRGYGHSMYIGESIAGAVLQVFRKVNRFEPAGLGLYEKVVQLPANVPTAAEAAEAHRICAIHRAGRDAELPYSGMMLTTVVAEAERMVRLEHGPDTVPARVCALTVGPAVIVGIAGEPFTGVGEALKETPGFEFVMPAVNTNGSEGYFPMMSAYEEGGYEARSSTFRPGTAEFLVDECRGVMKEAAERQGKGKKA